MFDYVSAYICICMWVYNTKNFEFNMVTMFF